MSATSMNDVVGELEVIVTFRLKVTDLEHYAADTLQDAARNMNTWYHDGSADVFTDVGCSDNIDVRVRVVEDVK